MTQSTIEENKKTRSFVVTDIHGCYDEFQNLLDKIQFSPNSDRLFFLGDAVDRGPEPLKIIHMLKNLNAVCVMGNHDERYLRFHQHEAKKKINPNYKNPMRSIVDNKERHNFAMSLSEEDIKFISGWKPYYFINDELLGVHAGIQPSIPMHKQKEAILYHVRFLSTIDNKMLTLGSDFSQPENSYFWTENHNHDFSVIYGHNVMSLEEPYITTRKDNPKYRCVGLDTGACFGGKLTAYFVEENRFISVNSKFEYARQGSH